MEPTPLPPHLSGLRLMGRACRCEADGSAVHRAPSGNASRVLAARPADLSQMQWSRWRTWPQLGAARLLRFHNQTRRRLGDNSQRRLSCAGANHNVPLVFTPFRRLLDVAIVRSGDKHTRHSIAFELKALTRPAGERDVIFFRTIHSALGAVLLEHMHPCSAKKL